MNCSESQGLRTLRRLLLELHHPGNASSLGAGPGHNMGLGAVPDPFLACEVTSAKGDNAFVYILLIVIFYACLARGLFLAYTRSRKLVEAKDEPSQPSAEHQWAAGGALAVAAETATEPLAEGRCRLAIAGLPTLAQGTQGV